MSYLLLAADINKGDHVESPPAKVLAQLPLIHHLRPRGALGRHQLNISKYQGENIPLQLSHLPHALTRGLLSAGPFLPFPSLFKP